MSNKITVYLGPAGTIGTIELETPGFNELYPINANVAPNANGHRVEPGEYLLDSIAYTPYDIAGRDTYGIAIIRFASEDGSKLAIFGGEFGPDGSLLPTEGSSLRVSNDALENIVTYIDERGGETSLTATDDAPGPINSV